MNTSRGVALLEMSGHHVECLYPQVKFLSSLGIPVHLVCSEVAASKLAPMPEATSLAAFPLGRGGARDVLTIWRLRKHLLSLGVNTVVLNTARGSAVRNLLLMPTSPLRFVGLAHIADKLAGGSTQRVVARKTHSFLVLNDYIVPHAQKLCSTPVRGIYLIYFPPYEPRPVDKGADEFWVCIPGQVEFKKRDYESLIDRFSERAPDRRIQFVLPGAGPADSRDGKLLREMLDARGLSARFRLWNQFLDHHTFFSMMAASDLILPLIHPKKPEHMEYARYKISGAFNLAFGMGLPMFCEESFAGIDDFDAGSLFYREMNLVERLNRLVRNREPLLEAQQRLRAYPKFVFETQRARYLQALFPEDSR